MGGRNEQTLAGLLVLALSTVNLGAVAATSSQINPRAVNPYGIQINDAYGSVTPVISMNMSAFAVCAQKPVPPIVLGVSCYNRSTNGTIVFNVTGFEVSQSVYRFLVQPFGNGTFRLVFLAAFQPTTSTLGQPSWNATISQLSIFYTSSVTDNLCVAFTAGGCGSGGVGGVIVGSLPLFTLLVAGEVGAVLFVLAAVVFSRRRSKRANRPEYS